MQQSVPYTYGGTILAPTCLIAHDQLQREIGTDRKTLSLTNELVIMIVSYHAESDHPCVGGYVRMYGPYTNEQYSLNIP